MNLQSLYEKTKELNYIEIEKLGAELSANFIKAYMKKTQIDLQNNPVQFLDNLLKLSIGVPFKEKLEIVKNDNTLKKEVEQYKGEVSKLNAPYYHIKSSSSVASRGFSRSFGSIYKQDNNKYVGFAENLYSLVKQLIDDEKLNKSTARKYLIDAELDFTLTGLTTNIVANILYPICPSAFPLTNSHCKAGFEYIGLEKERAKNNCINTYLNLATELEDKVFKELELTDEQQHFGIIDKMFHVYNKYHNIADFDSPNVILYGAPGTGKTYEVTEKLKFLETVDGAVVKKLQFHPSYTYEDFIEGIKPKGIDNSGNLKFELVNGTFKEFCINAKNNPQTDFYFVIDEINRANLSTVFGETLSLLEKDYRHDPVNHPYENLIETQYASLIANLFEEDEEKANSMIYARDKNGNVAFGVPKNVYFIGMMNDVDKSIDTFDLALRRRFKWVRKDCDYEVIINETKYRNGEDFNNIEAFAQCAEALNNYINEKLGLGSSYEFGHSFFMKIKDVALQKTISENNLETLFNLYMRPTLKEYLRAFYPESDIEGKNGKGGKLKEALAEFQKPLIKNETDSENES